MGRLAFPIYCFLISEGMAHTRNEKKYLGRLLGMALLSEAVYDWVLYPGDSIWAHQNVLWTLLLGAARGYCLYEAGRGEPLANRAHGPLLRWRQRHWAAATPAGALS